MNSEILSKLYKIIGQFILQKRNARIKFLASMMLILTIGCAFHVRIDPYPKIPKLPEKLPIKVGILIKNMQLKQMYTQRFCLVGIAHT